MSSPDVTMHRPPPIDNSSPFFKHVPPAPWNLDVQAGVLGSGRVQGNALTRSGAHSPYYLRNNFGICLKEDVGSGSRCCLFDEKGDVHCQMKACIRRGDGTSVCAANGSPHDQLLKGRQRSGGLPTIAFGTQSCDVGDLSTCDLIDIPYQVCSETPMVLPPCPEGKDYRSTYQYSTDVSEHFLDYLTTPVLPFMWSKNPTLVDLVKRIKNGNQ